MQFGDPFEGSARWCGRGGYADLNAVSEDDEEEEALSLCDLPLYENSAGVSAEWESTLRDSNAGCSDHQDFDFGFDFDFGRSDSTAYQGCPADDLFHDGRLLPLTLHRSWSEASGQFSQDKSNSRTENRRLIDEKLKAWGTESLQSSSYWTSSSSSSSSVGSQRKEYHVKKFRYDNSAAAQSSKPKSKRQNGGASNCTPPKPPPPLPPSSRSKTSNLKWQQFFTLGLMKTPPMKLEEIRLRQGKPVNNNGAEKSVLKRSVSCNYEEGPKLAKSEPKAANFLHKSKSVRENTARSSSEEAARSRGWRILAPLTSLNGCKASTDSVINCSTASKKRVDGGGDLAEVISRRLSTKMIPFYEDQNSLHSARGFTKLADSDKDWRR